MTNRKCYVCDGPLDADPRDAELASLRAELAALKARPVGVPDAQWRTMETAPEEREYVVLLPSGYTCLAHHFADSDTPWLATHGEVFPIAWCPFPQPPEVSR